MKRCWGGEEEDKDSGEAIKQDKSDMTTTSG